MHITSHVANRPATTEIPFEIKNGEIYSAQIKERLSDKEAVLQIRGKEMVAQFEGKVPTGERVTIQVTDQQDQRMTVKEIEGETTSSNKKLSDLSQILQRVGITGKEAPEVKEAVKLLLDKGSPLSKEIVHELKAFFEKAEGTPDLKSVTVRALLNKGLEVTQTHLRAIHEALHGKPLNEVLNNIAKELKLDLSDSEKPIVSQRVEQIGTRPVSKESVPEMSPATTQAPKQNGTAEVISKIRSIVEKEPDLQKAIQAIKAVIANNPKIDKEIVRQIERVSSDAEKLQSIGKDRIIQALKNAEAQILAKEQNQQPVVKAEAVKSQTGGDVGSIVKELKNEVLASPNLQRSIDKVQKEVLRNSQLPTELSGKIEKAVNEANVLLKQGRITTGREVLGQALATLENELRAASQSETQRVESAQRQTVESRPTDAIQRQFNDPRTSEVIKQVKEAVQQEPRLQKAVEQVRDQIINNPKIDREVAQKIERAVQEATQLQKLGREGAVRERLVQALANAEVEVNQAEIRRAETVARQPVDTRPSDATPRQHNETRASEVIRQVKEAVQQEPRLQKAVEQVRHKIINNPKIDREVAQKIERAVQEATQLQKLGREGAGRERLVQALANAEVEMNQAETRRAETTVRQPVETRPTDATPRQHNETRASEVIRQVKEAVQQEPRLQKAVEQVRDQIINNPKIDREVAQKIERAVQEATQLQKLGREGAGRERLVQALANAEVEMNQAEARKAGSQQVEAAQSKPAESRPVEPNTRQQVEARPADMNSRHSAETRPTETSTNLRPTSDAKLGQPADTTRQQPTTTQDATLKDSIKHIREQLQTETDIKKVLPKIQDQIIHNKNIDPEVARSIEKAANQANQLDQAGRERLIKLLQQIETSLKQAETQQSTNNQNATTDVANQAGKQGAQTNTQTQAQTAPQPSQQTSETQSKLPSETIQQALKQFQSESDVEKAIDLVRKEVSSNPNIDLNNISKIEKSLENAQQLSDRGREIAARQQVAKELTDIQQALVKSEPKPNASQTVNNQYDVNELLQSMQIQSKDLLVTRVTQKLAEATHEFRDLKREITRTLDSVQRNIDLFKSSSYPQASKMLETAISKLDNAILKSDMMLFTDMKTEKQLLQASSQLADAKKLLAKGHFSEASKIVGQVKELIDKINFKPSDQKVMHFVGKESLAMENRNTVLETGARGYTMQEPSARHMFETVRSLGLNHDSELANSLVFKNGEQAQQEQQQNMKAVLMKLQQEEAGTRVAQQAEQALNNLTGQQLLSKADSTGSMQSMLFNLPMLLGGDPKNLQVFVNSKNEGNQVDWENCNLYFLIETKKLGDVGIMLTSTERNLSITIKNDKPGFKEKMEPLASMAKEKLMEIGYNVSGLHFTRMTPTNTNSEVNQTIDQTPNKPTFTEKGLDFKI